MLKILVNNDVPAGCDPNEFDGVAINSAYLRQYYQSSAPASGKGPLPPKGGIDSMWHKKAWIRHFAAAACSGAVSTNRLGLGSEVCAVTGANAPTVYTFNPDASVHIRFQTTHDSVPSQEIGALGTALGPRFAYLAAGGSTTGRSSTGCITVTIVPSVTLSSASTNAMTSITLSGLIGAEDSDNSDKPIFAGAGCRCVRVWARVFARKSAHTGE